jgi:hypothetical protein
LGQSGTEGGVGFSVSVFDDAEVGPEAIVGYLNATGAAVYAGDVSDWSAATRSLTGDFGGTSVTRLESSATSQSSGPLRATTGDLHGCISRAA